MTHFSDVIVITTPIMSPNKRNNIKISGYASENSVRLNKTVDWIDLYLAKIIAKNGQILPYESVVLEVFDLIP